MIRNITIIVIVIFIYYINNYFNSMQLEYNDSYSYFYLNNLQIHILKI